MSSPKVSKRKLIALRRTVAVAEGPSPSSVPNTIPSLYSLAIAKAASLQLGDWDVLDEQSCGAVAQAWLRARTTLSYVRLSELPLSNALVILRFASTHQLLTIPRAARNHTGVNWPSAVSGRFKASFVARYQSVANALRTPA